MPTSVEFSTRSRSIPFRSLVKFSWQLLVDPLRPSQPAADPHPQGFTECSLKTRNIKCFVSNSNEPFVNPKTSIYALNLSDVFRHNVAISGRFREGDGEPDPSAPFERQTDPAYYAQNPKIQ